MDVSIIIVNWNSVAFLRKCLASIYRNSAGLDVEVIIVDNASYDGSHEVVANEFPQATFIQSQDNLGFAKANNLGAARARGTRLLFLNPDTEILGDAISQMAAVFVDRPDAGAVGCKLINTDGSLQTSCIQPFPTILNQAFIAEVLLRVASKVGVWGAKPLFLDAQGISPVQVISGACLMVKKDAFNTVGGFSADYFMYTEDIDLCYKIWKAGFINYYTSIATVLHHGGGSSKSRRESSFADIQMGESVYKFLRKTRGGLYANGYRATMFIVAVVRIGLISILFMPSLLMGRFTVLRYSFIKWIGILRWSLALEKWAR